MIKATVSGGCSTPNPPRILQGLGSNPGTDGQYTSVALPRMGGTSDGTHVSITIGDGESIWVPVEQGSGIWTWAASEFEPNERLFPREETVITLRSYDAESREHSEPIEFTRTSTATWEEVKQQGEENRAWLAPGGEGQQWRQQMRERIERDRTSQAQAGVSTEPTPTASDAGDKGRKRLGWRTIALIVGGAVLVLAMLIGLNQLFGSDEAGDSSTEAGSVSAAETGEEQAPPENPLAEDTEDLPPEQEPDDTTAEANPQDGTEQESEDSNDAAVSAAAPFGVWRGELVFNPLPGSPTSTPYTAEFVVRIEPADGGGYTVSLVQQSSGQETTGSGGSANAGLTTRGGDTRTYHEFYAGRVGVLEDGRLQFYGITFGGPREIADADADILFALTDWEFVDGELGIQSGEVTGEGEQDVSVLLDLARAMARDDVDPTDHGLEWFMSFHAILEPAAD